MNREIVKSPSMLFNPNRSVPPTHRRFNCDIEDCLNLSPGEFDRLAVQPIVFEAFNTEQIIGQLRYFLESQ